MNNEEDIIQAACYKWFHNTFPHYRYLLFSVPNGGLRSKQTANKLRSTGLVAGIPDLIFVWHGSATGLECKVPGAGLTGEQPKVHHRWQEFGLIIEIFHSLDEFQKIILKIIAK